MTKHIKYVGFFAASFVFCINSADFFDKMFEELEANIKEMQEFSQKPMQDVADAFKDSDGSFKQALAHTTTTDTDNVIVSITGFDIPADKINDQIAVNPSNNSVKVNITGDQGYAVYTFTQNSLKMHSEYKAEAQSSKSDSEDSKSDKKPVAVSYHKSQHFGSLPEAVDLSKIAVEYNTDENTLVIILPKLHKKISVNVKQKPKIAIASTEPEPK